MPLSSLVFRESGGGRASEVGLSGARGLLRTWQELHLILQGLRKLEEELL